MTEKKILLVDDEADIRSMLARFLNDKHFSVVEASTCSEAIEAVQKNLISLAIIDLIMPDTNGIDILKKILKINSNIIGIIVTGFATINSAVEAMKAGAFDYLPKPFNLEEMLITINKALEYQNLKGENVYLKEQLRTKYKFENFIGSSDLMLKVFKTIETIANTSSTVLIFGDSGTGKELVAKAIHYNSNRKDKYLVPVNCGAIPEDLLESELFGHIKGSFTGAINTRIGRFEYAHGGTIFLDEIGDMSLNLQVKLLRVLQEKEITPVGGTNAIKIDVRVIAATNQDLEKAVAEKKFREDLYYRLNVIPIHLPTLRERKSDIPLLVNHFLEKMRKEKGTVAQSVSDEVMSTLLEYEWPGNVRELENLMERMVIFSGKKERLSSEDLPEKFRKSSVSSSIHKVALPSEGLDLNNLLDDIENDLIRQALDKTHGIKEKAAKLLGLNRTTLVQKIKKKSAMGKF